jgi:acyl dehydratase
MSAYDAITVGETATFGTYEFTAERIKAWARRWDPQRFHVSEAEAAKSIYGALIASGWHTCAVMMRLQVDHFAHRPGPKIRFGPSPGFENLKWLKGVYAGDKVTYSGRVTEKRLSQSRPGLAIITTEFTGVNQNGETVMSMTAHVFVAVE